MESHDPYAAPATLPVAPPVVPASPVRSPLRPDPVAVPDVAVYYSPSTAKLITLSFVTLSLYPLYWFWRNWQAIRDESGGEQWPWARAIFAPLWSFLCFRQLEEAASSRRRSLAFPPAALAVVFFLLNFSARLPKAGWLLALFTFLPLLPVNSLLRQYHQDNRVDLRRMDRFGVGHILVTVFGGMLLLLALLGLTVLRR